MTLTIYNCWSKAIHDALKAARSSAGRGTWDSTYKNWLVRSGIYMYRPNLTRTGFSDAFIK